MEQKLSSHKFDILIALYVFCILLAEIMGSKSFPIAEISGYKLTGAIGMFLIPFIYSINDIVNEVYGIEKTKNMGKISLIVVALFIVFAAFAVSLPPSERFKSSESAYELIFTQSIRISLASLISIGIANFFDIYFFHKLKKKLASRGLWLRNNLSNIFALLLDTVIFMTLAFYDFSHPFNSNVTFLTGIILPYWILKMSMSVLGTPLVYLGVKWLKGESKKS